MEVKTKLKVFYSSDMNVMFIKNKILSSIRSEM